MGPYEYSIVIPVYNEEESLPELIKRLATMAAGLDGSTEVIFVDDGSTDGSYALMMEASRRSDHFRVVQLSRNFGHQVAITAGLDLACGQAVVIMDADMQDPPEMVPELIARWKEGNDVVFAVREERIGDSAFKRASASLFYRLLRRVTEIDTPLDVGDFRLLDRKAVEAFKLMRERNRYVRGMFSWIGFKQTGIPYDRPPRFAGKTKYSFLKMLKFGVDGIVSFSNLPLRLVLNLGFMLSVVSFLLGCAAIVLKLGGVYAVPGWASLIVAIAFLAGIQLTMLGMIGEYVARIHDEVKDRPLYLVSRLHGFPSISGEGSRDGSIRLPTRLDAGLDRETSRLPHHDS